MDQDIFYDASELSHDEQEALLCKAHSICERWWFDKLDCSESLARQRVRDISFEEAMEHFGDGALMNIIHRWPVMPIDEPHLEVGFRSMESPVDYFLWVIVSLDQAGKILNGLAEL